MVAIPDDENSIENLIDRAYAEKVRSEEKPRPHMGISMIGHPCDRWLWLSFRWAVREEFNGRMYRLFNRGHREEENLIKLLEMIGVDFSGSQIHVDFGSHVSGSADAGAESGVPHALMTPHIVEFKTHSLKSFNKLSMEGVQKSKPMHYAQMQGYMHGTKYNRALYVAICKDDDRLYTERVHYDKPFAERLIERAKRIALADRMPEPISADPSWYECKFCPAYRFCHQKEPTKFAHCRTCAFSTAEPDSTWSCTRHEAENIPLEFQYEGCEDHVIHPDMVPWGMRDSNNPHTIVYIINDKPVENGRPDANVFASSEILAAAHACTNQTVQEIRKMWPGAKVVK